MKESGEKKRAPLSGRAKKLIWAAVALAAAARSFSRGLFHLLCDAPRRGESLLWMKSEIDANYYYGVDEDDFWDAALDGASSVLDDYSATIPRGICRAAERLCGQYGRRRAELLLGHEPHFRVWRSARPSFSRAAGKRSCRRACTLRARARAKNPSRSSTTILRRRKRSRTLRRAIPSACAFRRRTARRGGFVHPHRHLFRLYGELSAVRVRREGVRLSL